MNERTITALADEIIADLPEKLDLIYVDRGDRLTDEQVGHIVAGRVEDFNESIEEWESDSRYSGAEWRIKDAAEDVLRRWAREDDEDYGDLWDEFHLSAEEDRVREEMYERESGDWVRQLMSGTPDVLLRINVLDEDHDYAFEDVQPERVLTDVGLPVNESNLRTMRDTLAECAAEYSVLLGYWIVGADVADMWALPSEGEVEIVNPYLYLGNPFAGSGWISEEPFEGVVRVAREDLRTDADAFGYSVNEVFGGLSGSQYQCTIRPVTDSG